jgi:hypothetical protein
MRAAPPPRSAEPLTALLHGHLARLVERARPTESLLQRRQPSLYERTGPRADAHPHGDEQVSEVIARRPIEPPRSEPSATRATPSQRPERNAGDVTRPQAVATAQASQPVLRQELRLLRETLRIDASVGATREAALPAQRRPHEAAPALASTATAVTRMDSPRPIDAAAPVATRSLQRSREELPASRQHHQGEAAAPLPARESPAVDTAPLLRPARPPSVASSDLPRAAQRAGIVQAAMRRPPTQPAPSRQELPPVQVTIGRVEVRAVAAPAAAERRTRAAPRLSLEQYLRDRQGGGR